MKIKYNFIFIPLLLIVVAVFFYFTKKEENQEASKRLADRALVNFDTLDILEITGPDVNIRLEKIGGSGESGVGTAEDWRMVKPYGAGCDPETLAAFMNALKTAESERDIPNVTADQLAEYGLDNPELRIVASSGASSNVMMDLLIGNETTAGTSRYAAFEKSDLVYLVPIYQLEGFEVTTDKIRDKRAMRFKRDDVISFQLSSAEGEIAIEKVGSQWKLTAPQNFTANPSRVDVVFHDLEELAAKEFVGADFSDPRLDMRNVDVTLNLSGGKTNELHILGEDITKGYYAESSWQPSPFIVEAYIYERLAVPWDVFFYTVLFDLPPETIRKIVVRQPGGENIEIERTGTGQGDWKVVKPEDAVIEDSGVFGGLIDAMLAMEPDNTVTEDISSEGMGLSPSYFLKIEVVSETGEQYALKLGKRDINGSYFATQDGSSFMTIPSQDVEAFLQSADKIR